jgi:hypothetical protein
MLAFSVFAPGPGRLVFPYYAGVAHALALSLGAILLVRNGRPGESTRSLLSGLLAGLAFCAKQEVGVAALAALVGARFPRPKELVSQGGRAVGGFLLAVLPGAFLAASNASLRSLREDNHLWPVDVTPPPEFNGIYRMIAGMSAPNWSASVREVAWGLLLTLLLLALAAMLFAREPRLSRWRPALILAGALLVWWLVEGFSQPFRPPVELSASVAFFVALFAIFRRDLPYRPRLIAIGVFAGLVGARTIFAPGVSGHYDGPAHLASSLTWVVFLCIVAPVLLAPATKATLVMRRMATILLLVVAGFGAVAGADSLRYPWKRRLATRMGNVFLPPNEASFFEKLRGELQAGETALVIPEINAVDVLFGVRSVPPLLDLMPGWLDAHVERELIPRLEQSPPDVVVIFHRPMPEFGFSRFGRGYGMLLEEWILRNYRPVLSDRGGSIFRRRPSAIGPILTPGGRRSKPCNRGRGRHDRVAL